MQKVGIMKKNRMSDDTPEKENAMLKQTNLRDEDLSSTKNVDRVLIRKKISPTLAVWFY